MGVSPHILFRKVLFILEGKYARDIKDCSECPLEGQSCISMSPHSIGEPPCVTWSEDEFVTKDWIESKYVEAELYYMKEQEDRRKRAGKRAAITRKEYAKYDEIVEAYKEWSCYNAYSFIFVRRDKDLIYLREQGKMKATFVLNMKSRKILKLKGIMDCKQAQICYQTEKSFGAYLQGYLGECGFKE